MCAIPSSVCLAALSLAPVLQDAAGAERALVETLAADGIRIDAERELVSVRASVLVREELLEYVLVGPRGATHESLFLTTASASLLNAALLTLGVEPGLNARWEEDAVEEVDGMDHPERVEARRKDYHVLLPEGDALLLYAAWREGDESYLYRVDDLLANLDTGRSMRRHGWVYLGSRFKSPAEGEPELFVADLEQNLVNLSFFYQGNTLLTSALPECERQTIWIANAWLLPPRETPVELVFTREPILRLPPEWEASLPDAALRGGAERDPRADDAEAPVEDAR